MAFHGLVAEAYAAMDRISGTGVLHTRMCTSLWLKSIGGSSGPVLLKLENEQVTGSFKPRGAVNKILSLSNAQLAKGVVACSSGNFALGILHACSALEHQSRPPVRPQIFLPISAAVSKLAALKELGAEVVLHGHDVVEAEREARRVADASGAHYCSPYNDMQVAGGAGTIALEVLADMERPAEGVIVFVPVGGGGLIAGVAAVLKSVDSSILVIGCQPGTSDVMGASVAAGRILDQESGVTLSDGSAGGVEEGSLTFEPCCRFVDGWQNVSEPQIAAAMVGMLREEGISLEGAAGMTVAAAMEYLRTHPGVRNRTAVIICCGGNISDSRFGDAQRLAACAVQPPWSNPEPALE